MTFIIIKSASRQYMQRHKEKFPNGVNQIIFRSNNLDSAREFLLNILNGLCHVEFADWAEAKKTSKKLHIGINRRRNNSSRRKSVLSDMGRGRTQAVSV